MWKDGYQIVYFLFKLITIVISKLIVMESLIILVMKNEIVCNQYV